MASVKLNKEQLEAVRHKKGPLMIIAGAGTGKTTVITERIKHLIEKGAAKPSEILALTFTEKAAREMEERVDVALPFGYTQMWISTFHSFCDRVLRAEALHVGLDPRYKLMTQAETVQLIRKNLFNFKLKYFRPLGNPTKFVSGMLQHFSRLQDEDVSPKQYLRWVKARNAKRATDETEKLEIEKWEELSLAYKKYDEIKTKEGRMDYGDLIVKTLQLYRKRPNILKQYRKQFKQILVDEYQDTNISQNELVKLLAGKNGNVAVVLDDDQSIYRFRGAAISNALQFRKSFPKTKVVTLIKNYRASQEILDKAYGLIQHNNPDRLEALENIDKRLQSKFKFKGEVKFIHTDRVENEAEEVVKRISELVNQDNQKSKTDQPINRSTDQLEYRDVAILVRANNHADPFTRALQRKGIPYQFLGPGRLFKQPEIVDLISYLKVLYNFEDDVSFYRLLTIQELAISQKDLARIANYARKYNLSLYDACKKLKDIYINEETRDKIERIVKIIDRYLKRTRKETAGQLLYFFLEDSGLLTKLLNPDSSEAQKRAKNIGKFFDKLKTYEVDNEDATVLAAVDWIELAMELGESPLAADSDWTDINAVNILTVHSAKGLEFPVVFLVNLVGQRFPTINRREQIPIPNELIKEVLPQGDFHIQEERRLFYVGMTRAKEKLYLTAANYYGEGKREKRLSPFIFETLGDEAVSSEKRLADSEQLSFLDYKQKTQPSTIHPPPSTVHIDYLSYSQIETFRICPLHYKLRYILKVPTPPGAALSFGSSIHNSMRDFYLLAAGGKKATPQLTRKLLKENWIKEGYSSKAEERENFKRGKKYLHDYLREGFNKRIKVAGTELPFVVPLKQPNSKTRPLKAGGRIDRMDKFRGGKIEIVDYKTGKNVPTQKAVDNNLQLTFYALAATTINDEIFGKKPEEVKLTLYYFEEQKAISTTKTKEQLKEAVKEIYEWREKIESSDFKCSKHLFCNKCEFKMFCGVDE